MASRLARQTDAGWSSLVARRAHNPKVVGSNPAPATNCLNEEYNVQSRSVRQTDAGWSSLVARRAHNPKVVGSNPAPATTSSDEEHHNTLTGVFLFLRLVKSGIAAALP